MRKVLSWVLIIGVLCGVMLPTAIQVNAAPMGQELQTMEAMDGLLTGITGEMLTVGDVAEWSDELVARFLSNKMLWDGYGDNSWLATMGIPTDASGDGYIHVERSVVDQLTRDALGRAFVPVELPYMLEISGSEVLFGQAAGEFTDLVVQDYVQRGEYYVAVGCIAWFGGAGSEVDAYFQAVFQKNDNSMYGMTLVSLEEIHGNQSFSSVTAEASSVLSGGDYKAANVLDGNMGTAWVEGTAGTGVGEFVELVTSDGSAMDLCAIEIDPGYHKNDDILAKNGWPGKIRIETDAGVVVESYCYSTETQAFLFQTPVQTQWMRITILEAESGNKYTDTCISEIRLMGMDTEKYFRNLELDLPGVSAQTESTSIQEQKPGVVTLAEIEIVDSQSAPVAEEHEKPIAEKKTVKNSAEFDNHSNRQIIVLGIMDEWDIADFIEDNLLLVVLIGAGGLVVVAGIAVLIVLLRKKK